MKLKKKTGISDYLALENEDEAEIGLLSGTDCGNIRYNKNGVFMCFASPIKDKKRHCENSFIPTYHNKSVSDIGNVSYSSRLKRDSSILSVAESSISEYSKIRDDVQTLDTKSDCSVSLLSYTQTGYAERSSREGGIDTKMCCISSLTRPKQQFQDDANLNPDKKTLEDKLRGLKENVNIQRYNNILNHDEHRKEVYHSPNAIKTSYAPSYQSFTSTIKNPTTSSTARSPRKLNTRSAVVRKDYERVDESRDEEEEEEGQDGDVRLNTPTYKVNGGKESKNNFSFQEGNEEINYSKNKRSRNSNNGTGGKIGESSISFSFDEDDDAYYEMSEKERKRIKSKIAELNRQFHAKKEEKNYDEKVQSLKRKQKIKWWDDERSVISRVTSSVYGDKAPHTSHHVGKPVENNFCDDDHNFFCMLMKYFTCHEYQKNKYSSSNIRVVSDKDLENIQENENEDEKEEVLEGRSSGIEGRNREVEERIVEDRFSYEDEEDDDDDDTVDLTNGIDAFDTPSSAES
jgi:hypothetical protein